MADPNKELNENKSEPFPKKKFLISLAVTFLSGVAVSIIYDYAKGLFSMTEAPEKLKVLADSFTIPGVLLLCLAALIFSKRQGTFDGLTYSVRYFANALIPQFWLSKEERGGKFPKYPDYKDQVREKEKNRFNISLTFLIIGIVFIITAVILILVR